MAKKTAIFLCSIFFVSLAIRVLFNVYYVGLDIAPQQSVLLATDEGKYHKLAKALLHGEGFGRSAWTPPGFPLMLSGLYRVCGENIAYARLAQTVLSSLTVLLIFFLGLFIYGRGTGFIAASIASVYPFFVFWTGAVITETLFVFLCVAGILSLSYYFKTGKMVWNCCGGLILGYAALTRPVALTLPVFLLFAYYLFFRDWKRTIISVVMWGVMFTAVIAPWTIRNYAIFKEIIPITTQSGMNLLNGINSIVLQDPSKTGELMYKELPEYKKLPIGDEVMMEEQAGAIAKAYYRTLLKEDKGLLLRIEWEKFKHFWALYPQNRGTAAKVISVLSFGGLLPFFIIGLLASRKNKNSYLLFSFILNILCIAMIYFANIRYRFPIEPFYIIYAAYGIVLTWGAWRFSATNNKD